MFPKVYTVVSLFALSIGFVRAQSVFSVKEALFTIPRQYTALFTNTPPVIDGKIDEAAWRDVAWTENFKGIEGDSKPAPTWNTRAKMTWTAQGL